MRSNSAGKLATLRVFALAALFGVLGCEEKKKEEPPPVKVFVAEVEVRDVPVHRTWLGSISGAQHAQIEARVSGYLMSQEYDEGSLVMGGQVLFRIDPRPYQAALAQAQAQLAQAVAKAELAKITLERQTELFKTQVISAQEFDVATQTAQADIADVAEAEANVEAAQLNLEFCTARAWFLQICA
jgi:membrane fusion protein (multidrug efflux system)